MISKKQLQYIRSLRLKKFREAGRQYVAEGTKLVLEMVTGPFRVAGIYATADWLKTYRDKIPHGITAEEVSEPDMARISSLSTPSPVLAVIDMPQTTLKDLPVKEGITLVLDDIQDPGNLGTIIRIADWFGIGRIICSPGTVELYNPKVIQSTMGSIKRVQVIYADLGPFLEGRAGNTKIYGTFLEGENIYSAQLPKSAIIVIGNEANGISPKVGKWVSDKITIPVFRYSEDEHGHAESLNAAVATAVVCSEFRRRNYE
jgi:TrmH family RNA methyltransferase